MKPATQRRRDVLAIVVGVNDSLRRAAAELRRTSARYYVNQDGTAYPTGPKREHTPAEWRELAARFHVAADTLETLSAACRTIADHAEQEHTA